MADLSVGAAWNETVSFLRRDGRLVLPIAFLFVALPPAMLQLLGGPSQMATPRGTPEPGIWLLLLPVSMILSMIGTIAIAHLAMRPGASVGEALGVGGRRFLPLLGATLLIVIVVGLVTVPILLLAGGAAALQGNPQGASGAATLLLLLFLLIAIAVWVRLLLMTPVAAAEPVGPVGIIRRSWNLTAGHFWQLLGFVLLCIVAALVLTLAITAVVGIPIVVLAGQPELGSASYFLMMLLTAVVQSGLVAIFATLLARIYLQLAGPRAEVFA